jgi:hypothetical protein
MAFLVSPAGISGSLTSLLLTYNRWDILVYDRPKGKIPRSIALGTWDPDAEYLDNNAIIGPQ